MAMQELSTPAARSVADKLAADASEAAAQFTEPIGKALERLNSLVNDACARRPHVPARARTP